MGVFTVARSPTPGLSLPAMNGWTSSVRKLEDELVRRITESFIAYRDSVGGYMTYADNGQMNARASVMGY